MSPILKSIVLSLSLIIFVNSLDNFSVNVDILKYGVPCNLEWVNHIRGRQFPKNTAYLESTSKNVIARSKILNQFVVGSARGNELATFLSNKEGRIIEKSKFEILSNPNNCQLEWNYLPIEEITQYLFSVNKTYTTTEGTTQNSKGSIYIGRVKDASGNWAICNLYRGNKNCEIISENTKKIEIKPITEVQILQSLTPMLQVKLENITVSENVEILDVQFTGNDRIINKADAEVSTSVSHSQSRSDGTTSDSSTSFTASTNGGSGTISSSTSDDTDDSSDIDVSYDIMVPALTSVQFCSTTNIPSLKLNYEATAIFSGGPYLTAQNVEKILIMEKFNVPFETSDENGTVKTKVSGIKNGIKETVSSSFDVNPVNAYKLEGCETIKAKVEEERVKRIQDEIKRLGKQIGGVTQEQINSLIERMYKGVNRGWDFVKF